MDYCVPFLGESFLVIMDAELKWLEFMRMSSTIAEATVQALCFTFSTHGLPEELVSDNGSQFIAQDFKDFLRGNNTKHILSAPYHPASNGESEWAVQTSKQVMKAAKGDSGCLTQKICSFLLSYHVTPHSATGYTQAELQMNRRLRTRLDLCPDLRRKTVKPSKSQARTPKRQLCVKDLVLALDYRKNQEIWTKGGIISKLGPVTYRVQVQVFIWKSHIDQLKDLSGTRTEPPTLE